jgi:death on curing protein
LGLPLEAVPPVHLEQCNRGIIESALASPAAGFGAFEKYPDLPAKAAALTHSLAKSQACLTGNKRLALILLNEFLAINGVDLEMTDDEAGDLILYAADSDPAFRDQVIVELATRLEPALRDTADG